MATTQVAEDPSKNKFASVSNIGEDADQDKQALVKDSTNVDTKMEMQVEDPQTRIAISLTFVITILVMSLVVMIEASILCDDDSDSCKNETVTAIVLSCVSIVRFQFMP